MAYFLAVDGGGTKTHVLCADDQGKIVGEGMSGPTNLTATTIGAASFNLREAIRQATQGLPEGWQVQYMVMGLAGMDTQVEAENAKRTFHQIITQYPIQDYLLVNDIVIALASGSNKPDAVALIAGTGSNCYGKNAEGQEAKSGGMDYLLTDQGSGYEVGRYVLRSAVKSYDGRIEKTILEELVCQHFQISSIGELKDKVYNPPLTKSEVATLTKICDMAFEKGDRIAQEVYDHAVEEQFLMVSAVLRRLKILDRAVDCVLVGGLTKSAYICGRLREKLVRIAPQINLISPDKPPVYGALELVLQK